MIIPDELTTLKQWGCFHKIWDEKRGKYNKIPINAYDGSPGKSDDPSTWSDINTAIRAVQNIKNCDGLAFYFANSYVGLDVDHIADDLETYKLGNEESLVSQIKRLTKSTYMEISVSGEGIHAIFKGKIPGNRRRKGQFEMYETGRFFALTGNCISTDKVQSLNKDEMKKLYTFAFGEDKVIPISNQIDEEPQVDLSISEIINKAYDSAKGERFKLFMQGGWEKFYNSQSEADMAFANDLAFWCGRDFNKMDTIFRNSSLMRDKYDEKHGATTYGIATLRKAINETHEVYNPSTNNDRPKITFSFNQPKKKTPPRSWDDMGMAMRFMDKFGDIFKYSFIDKTWFVYNGSYWEKDNKGYIERACDQVINSLKSEKPVIDTSLDEKEQEQALKNWNKFVKHSRSAKAKKDLIIELKHHVPVMHSEFDKDLMLLNTPSGYIDLTSSVLSDHDREKMFTQQTNTDYSENTDCPNWKRFLKQIFQGDEELIHYIQKTIGYAATGSTREQCMFILFGNGRNGKSVFLDTLQNVLGTYTKTMNVSSIMVKYGGASANSDIARLEGSRMVISSEANEGNRLDEGLVKQLTGGDSIVARHLYGSEFEYTPTFKIFMATNHKPLIRGTDDGIWRRLKMIPFKYQVPEDKVDKDLKFKLEAESIGILKWIVDGALMWQSEGLREPEVVKNESQIYRNEMDVISMFINDCCQLNPDYRERGGDLFSAYTAWAKETNNYSNMNKNKFGIEMKKRFKKIKTGGYMTYIGLRLTLDNKGIDMSKFING